MNVIYALIINIGLLQLWGISNGVDGCELSVQWKRYSWFYNYSSAYQYMWTVSFSAAGNIRLQKIDKYSTDPTTEWECSQSSKSGNSTYIYSTRERVGGTPRNRAYCFHIIDQGHVLLLRKTPVNFGQSDCPKKDDTSLPFILLIKRSVVKCDSSSEIPVVNGWMFKHERNNKLSHTAAEQQCFNWGGHLAWFSSAEEHQQVADALAQFANLDKSTWFGTLKYHIGYVRSGDEFITVDGDKSPGFYNWGNGEPNSQSCVITRADNRFKWEDASCSSIEAYLCKASCYKRDVFSTPSGECPFTKLTGTTSAVYYNQGQGDVCKNDDNSIAIFTQSDITLNTCTDSQTYSLPVQNTLTCLGTIQDEDPNKGNMLFLTETFMGTTTFYCARYKKEKDLYISVDVTDFLQAKCRPGHTYKSVGTDANTGGRYLHITVDLDKSNNNETPKPSVPTKTVSPGSNSKSTISSVLSSSSVPPSARQPSSNSSTAKPTVDDTDTDSSSGEPISGLGIGMIVLTIILIGIVIGAVLVYHYLAKNRYRTDTKVKGRNHGDTDNNDEDAPRGEAYQWGTIKSTPSYLSYKA